MTNNYMRPLQIGVIGSAADLNYPLSLERVAEKVGRIIARKGATLIFGAEQDYDSLSSVACRGARREGGLVIGVTYGRSKSIIEQSASAVIATGMERGGGRETAMVMSCDAVIAIGGGSGTLNEITIAYQAGIPVVALKNTGGWSSKLADTYLDERKRMLIYSARTPRAAQARS
ncbi:MAG: Rossmann fold nucleotide-binding protein, partial [Candidatus Magasanikbacteria bacterium GW2011_GWC2_45_8]